MSVILQAALMEKDGLRELAYKVRLAANPQTRSGVQFGAEERRQLSEYGIKLQAAPARLDVGQEGPAMSWPAIYPDTPLWKKQPGYTEFREGLEDVFGPRNVPGEILGPLFRLWSQALDSEWDWFVEHYEDSHDTFCNDFFERPVVREMIRKAGEGPGLSLTAAKGNLQAGLLLGSKWDDALTVWGARMALLAKGLTRLAQKLARYPADALVKDLPLGPGERENIARAVAR